MVTDIPFVLLFWLAIWASLGRRLIALPAAGLAADLAVAVRAPGCLVIGPTTLGLLLSSDSAASRPGIRGRRIAQAAALVLPAGLVIRVFWLVSARADGAAPSYARAATRVLHMAPLSILSELWAGAARLPRAVAHLMTSQRGYFFLELACLLLTLMLIGGIRLWRRGSACR